ncbi:hypothetical protein MIMGU_mgv1a017577mg [Erythranthe guttata]|uniref:Uncharacterized protein n=1 Tax=Erythranthe guttata TaxID=4155 RepID=A0A022R386_ERYGU|nr:hypothetical protein MIMGU_mgv1a017577mg [Erythranthe guttata]
MRDRSAGSFVQQRKRSAGCECSTEDFISEFLKKPGNNQEESPWKVCTVNHVEQADYLGLRSPFCII